MKNANKAQLDLKKFSLCFLILVFGLISLIIINIVFISPSTYTPHAPIGCYIGSEIECDEIRLRMGRKSDWAYASETIMTNDSDCKDRIFSANEISYNDTEGLITKGTTTHPDIESGKGVLACLKLQLKNTYGKNIRNINVEIRDKEWTNERIICQKAMSESPLYIGQEKSYEILCAVDPKMYGKTIKTIAGEMKVSFDVIGYSVTRTLTGDYNVLLDYE